MLRLAFLAIIGVVVKDAVLPPEQLSIASRVAGGGRPQCQRYLPDGRVVPCMPSFALADSEAVNALAQGGRITFTRGAVERLGRDEFALLAGHELAHWYLGHTVSNAANERAADRLGAELACKAGFNHVAGTTLFRHLRADRHHPAGPIRRAIVLGVRC